MSLLYIKVESIWSKVTQLLSSKNVIKLKALNVRAKKQHTNDIITPCNLQMNLPIPWLFFYFSTPHNLNYFVAFIKLRLVLQNLANSKVKNCGNILPTQKIKYWGKAESKYICDDAHIIFLYQQWLLAASHLTSNNMIIVPRLDADHITSAYLLIKTLFPLFSWICTEPCESREQDNTPGANIDIILLCQTSLRRHNIRPTRSFFLLPFHRKSNKFKEYFLPSQLRCKLKYLWPNPGQFCTEAKIKMIRHFLYFLLKFQFKPGHQSRKDTLSFLTLH